MSKIYVEPNDRGGWSLRWEGDNQQLGNYPTPADAKRIARHNFADVQINILVGAPVPASQPQPATA